MNLTESSRKKDLATQPPPLRLPLGASGGMVGGVLKAQGLKCRGRGPRPYNRKGAKGCWQTDRQNRLSAHYNKIPFSFTRLLLLY